jgi:hypothetical protein
MTRLLGRIVVGGALAALIGVPILVQSVAASDIEAGCYQAAATSIRIDTSASSPCDDAAEAAVAPALQHSASGGSGVTPVTQSS